jgi:glucose-6-phosphate dehydrogenase assembly protein OpcA
MGSPFDVEQRLAELWRAASTDEQPVLRACSMNLVVVCADGDRELAETTELVGRIAETVPGRALVVAPPRPKGADGLDVYVSAHCHRGAGGAQVCSEQVTIEPQTATLDRVPGTILQLLVEDMPVYTWWRRRGLDGEPLLEPLVALSDTWVLNSAWTPRPRSYLGSLQALATREPWPGHVVDMAWVRLEPWRDAIASFFDNPAVRPAICGITRVAIASAGPVAPCGATVAGAYLAGWIASRVGLHVDGTTARREDGATVVLEFSSVSHLAPGEIAAVTIDSEHNDAHVVFDARLAETQDCMLLAVSAGAHTLPSRRIRFPKLDTAALACGVVQQTGPDVVYESALSAATRIV